MCSSSLRRHRSKIKRCERRIGGTGGGLMRPRGSGRGRGRRPCPTNWRHGSSPRHTLARWSLTRACTRRLTRGKSGRHHLAQSHLYDIVTLFRPQTAMGLMGGRGAGPQQRAIDRHHQVRGEDGVSPFMQSLREAATNLNHPLEIKKRRRWDHSNTPRPGYAPRIGGDSARCEPSNRWLHQSTPFR